MFTADLFVTSPKGNGLDIHEQVNGYTVVYSDSGILLRVKGGYVTRMWMNPKAKLSTRNQMRKYIRQDSLCRKV